MIKIHVNSENLIREYGKVTGSLFIEVDTLYFPEENWDDFVIIVLGWWLKEVYSLLVNEKSKCTCLFMDGPYEYEISDEGEHWNVKLKERRRNLEVIQESKHLSSQIIKELLEISDQAIKKSTRESWEDDDFYELLRYNNLIKLKLEKGN